MNKKEIDAYEEENSEENICLRQLNAYRMIARFSFNLLLVLIASVPISIVLAHILRANGIDQIPSPIEFIEVK